MVDAILGIMIEEKYTFLRKAKLALCMILSISRGSLYVIHTLYIIHRLVEKYYSDM